MLPKAIEATAILAEREIGSFVGEGGPGLLPSENTHGAPIYNYPYKHGPEKNG